MNITVTKKEAGMYVCVGVHNKKRRQRRQGGKRKKLITFGSGMPTEGNRYTTAYKYGK